MNSHAITFPLNETKKIIVDLKDPLDLVCWDYSEPILLLDNNNVTTLTNSPIYFNIRDLRDFLKKALHSQLILDASITSDVGFIFNEYYYEASTSSIKKLQQQTPLTVQKYHLWEAHEDETSYVTWMYNDNDKNIVFEVTPSYPYFYCDKKQESNYISYKKWIKNYQPYLIAKLSRETALQWLKQAEHIVKTVDDNVNRWKKEYNQ